MPTVFRRSTAAFLALEAGLYLWFLCRDLFQAGAGSTPLKYAAIAVCLAFSLYWSARGGERLVPAALAFTLGADTFLLLLNRRYLLGVALFCVVQGLYMVRISRENGGRTLWGRRLALSLAALAALGRLGMLTALNALSLVYFLNFFCNAVQALGLALTAGTARRQAFAAGLVLFLCCDLCVGIFNVPGLAPEPLERFSRVGMWLFYLPAQVLITLSGLPDSD